MGRVRVAAKVLVTGGAGFIGSHVVDELVRRGFDVVVLDNFIGGSENTLSFPKSVRVIEGDISDPKACDAATRDVKTIFHLAAHAAEGQSVFIPAFNLRTNLLGSVTLLAAAINNKVENFVFTSSIAAYGRPGHLPVSEDEPLRPEDPYGITKKAFEDYLHVYYELGQIKPFIVRFFNVYGPRQRMNDPYRGVIPIFINKILKGEAPVIFGDGLQQRAFTYISDIVEPICNIVGNDKLINEPINIGSEEPWTVKALAELTIQKMGFAKAPVYVKARTSDVKVTFCDVSKARKLLGYKAHVALPQGLDSTIAWAKAKGAQDFQYSDLCEIPHLSHEVYDKKKI